ncbi:MAG: acetylornithine deacetylase [Pseudomonadales bacterium]|jgi:acetylornithine deacetylase
MDLAHYTQQLAQLVAQPSVSSTSSSYDQSNEAVIDLLASWTESLGFRVEKMAVPNNPGKFNLVATLGTGSGGLILSGHSDTVPCNPDKWQQDPWQLTQRDGALYGLGATDMKGFFPLALAASQHFKADEYRAPLIILATADEESSMSGAMALRDQSYPISRAAVIGEPTGLTPIRAHKGVMMESIRIIGQSGHSSNPELGLNAMDIAVTLLNYLKRLKRSLRSRYQDERFAISYPTMNFGCIHGGDSPNRICGEVNIHFDVRTLPDLTQDQLRQEIAEYCAKLAAKTGAIIQLAPLINSVPSFDAGISELVQLCEQLTENSAQTVAFGTEAPYLQAMGMDTVVMGPGSIDVAHQPNEFIELSQLEPAYALISKLIHHYCIAAL